MIKRLFLATLLTLVTSFIYADTSQYQVTVPVASQSQADWETGVNTALEQLLTQLTGNDKILNNKKMKNQLQQADSYVQSFTYVTDSQANGQPQNQLQVQFYPEAINELLQSAGGSIAVAPTPKDNSPTLIWMAVQTAQGKNLLSNNSKNDLAAALQDSAKQRNFAILMPMMDLQDMQDVTVDDIWQLNPTNLITAAKRYGTQNILAAKISPDISNNNQWQAQWLMVNGNQSTPGSVTGTNADDVINKMIAKISGNATKPVVAKNNSSGNETVTLHITNVNSLDDYAAILTYLRSLSAVSNANVANADPSDLAITVETNGGSAALTNAINNDNKMAAIPNTDNDTANLSYRWLNSANNNPPSTTNTTANTTPTNSDGSVSMN